ncbi:energy transducer TonB [Chondromyces crocatus]|uniref:TonB C-terminal domain-containing protein n=1 Tax=Chondromyces crocatus TaxID=52 RepID=A0A0K1ESP3_CHOCO|nr:energy transducer TonB [Chondromyces crocatus]AKT43628.1 uncharacterized protein CMC5_078630 [Chondromyces crocatus]
MSAPRRWSEQDDTSLEAALFRAARADQPPADARARALAALGLADVAPSSTSAQAISERTLSEQAASEQAASKQATSAHPTPSDPAHRPARSPVLPGSPLHASGTTTRPALPPPRSTASPAAIPLFSGVLHAEPRPSRARGLVQVTSVLLAAAAMMALLVPGLRPMTSRSAPVEVDLRTASTVAPRTQDAPPVLLSGRDPEYTPEARAARVEGLVVVSCLITEQGTLTGCVVQQSLPFMDQAVLDTLATWRFTPATRNGRPIAVEQIFTVRLTLPR